MYQKKYYILGFLLIVELSVQNNLKVSRRANHETFIKEFLKYIQKKIFIATFKYFMYVFVILANMNLIYISLISFYNIFKNKYHINFFFEVFIIS